MSQPLDRPHARSPWPTRRRMAWIMLFWAIFGWAAMVDPRPGVSRESLPLVGEVPL